VTSTYIVYTKRDSKFMAIKKCHSEVPKLQVFLSVSHIKHAVMLTFLQPLSNL